MSHYRLKQSIQRDIPRKVPSPTRTTITSCRRRLRALAVRYLADGDLHNSAVQVLALLRQREVRA